MKVQYISEYEEDTLFYNHCIKTDQVQQDYKPHYHEMYELLFLKEGNISWLTGGSAHSVPRNSLVITRPHQQHCIRIDRDTPYDRYDLLFTPETIDRSLLEDIPEELYVISFDSNPLAVQLFDKMDYYCEKLSGRQLGHILRSLTEEVLLNVHLQIKASREDPGSNRHPLTLRAMAYIANNLLTDVETVCRDLSISRSYLYQLFQTDLNTTPKRYIMERRLNLARQEIFLGTRPTDVYIQCGFVDYSTFFRAFKKHFGYPPTGTHHATFLRSSEEDNFIGISE